MIEIPKPAYYTLCGIGVLWVILLIADRQFLNATLAVGSFIAGRIWREYTDGE
jgi:hypothetical protein